MLSPPLERTTAPPQHSQCPPVLTPVLSPTQDSDTEPLRSSKTHCRERRHRHSYTWGGNKHWDPPQQHWAAAPHGHPLLGDTSTPVPPPATHLGG